MLLLLLNSARASCARSSFNRLIALSSSSTFVLRAVSRPQPWRMGAPSKVMSSFGTRMKYLKIWNCSSWLKSSIMISHLLLLSLRPVDVSALMMVLTSCANVGRFADKDRLSMNPISRSEFRSFKIGWTASQNFSELSGSPCYGPSLETIRWSPYTSVGSQPYVANVKRYNWGMFLATVSSKRSRRKVLQALAKSSFMMACPGGKLSKNYYYYYYYYYYIELYNYFKYYK